MSVPPGGTAAPQGPAPPKRRVSRAALAITAVALVTGVIGAVPCGIAGFGMLTAPAFDLPGTTTVEIADPGTYAVYEQSGWHNQAGPVSVSYNGAPSLRPADVVVTGPGGERIPVQGVIGFETLQRNDTVYTAAVRLEADTPGTYTVEVTRADGPSAIVTRSVLDQMRALAPWLVLLGVSAFVVASGMVAVLVSTLRAASANRRTAAITAGPPASRDR